MERPAPAPPHQRDIVYCHQCDNEWYRDEHGMTPCPECQGEFTEVIEDENDPRNAPDPEEEDIDHFEWRNNGGDNGDHHIHGTGTYTRSININGVNVQGGGGGIGGGLFGLLGGMMGGALQTALGNAQQPNAQQQPGQATQQNVNARGGMPGGPIGQQPGVYHREGPGYSYTIRSNVSLTPRNADGPQPAQHQPEDINRMMAGIFANMGTHPGGPGNFRFGPPPNFDDDDFGGGGPFAGTPFGNIFRMLGMPMGGVHGDAVYSQEALDRIITQLMEQNATGNAPGPASQQAIDSLPKKKISTDDVDEDGKAECTICMDDVPVGEEVTVLPCSHWFHFDCIKMWLAEHDTCPHCRKGIMPRDQAQNNAARSPNQAPLHNTHGPEYHTQQMPGGFPSSAASPNTPGSGDGSQQNPFQVPESPGQERQGSAGGMFSRMRETFGSGNGGSGTPEQRRQR